MNSNLGKKMDKKKQKYLAAEKRYIASELNQLNEIILENLRDYKRLSNKLFRIIEPNNNIKDPINSRYLDILILLRSNEFFFKRLKNKLQT